MLVDDPALLATQIDLTIAEVAAGTVRTTFGVVAVSASS
jgi:hypothetical protein